VKGVSYHAAVSASPESLRLSFAHRLRRTWSLLRILAPRQFRVRYRESALDLAWAVITPLAFLAVYGIVMTQFFDQEGSCAPYLTSAWTGLVLWTFFSGALGTATPSLIASTALITKIYFPREAIPLSEVGVGLIDLGIGLVTVVFIALVQGVGFTAYAFLMIPVLILLVVWTAGASVLGSALTVFVRDVGQGIQLFLRVGFFATPVMYEASIIPDSLEWIVKINPIAVAIISARATLLCGQAPPWGLLGAHLAAGFVLLIASIVYMRKIEGRFADLL
jgi:lipopolysaccharide transport system permease protein